MNSTNGGVRGLAESGPAAPRPPGGPTPATRAKSSRARYDDYLRRRREARSGSAPASAADLAGEDPNSPRRTRRSRSFATLAAAFWTMVRGRRGLVLACMATVALSALVGLAAPASTKIALDYILTDHPGPAGLPRWLPERVLGASRPALLWMLGGGLVAVTLVSVAASVWGRYQMTRLTQRTRNAVRRRVFNHAVRLPLHRVYELKSGGAASILREDAGQAADLCFSLLYNPWRAVISLAGTLVILAWTDWKLLVGGLAVIPAVWFTQKAWIGRIRPLHREVRATRTHVDAHATEAFGGMRVVRGFVRQRAEAARFIRNNHLMARQELLAWVWSRVIEVVWQVLLPAGSAAVLVYGGTRVLNAELTLGDVMMFSAYLIMLLGPLEALSASATSIQAELASLDRILDLLAEPEEFRPERPDGPATPSLAAPPRDDARGVALDPAQVRGRVTVSSMSFKYPRSDGWVLRGVDLDVPAGSTVALVGPSGAGKTTLCNLVARFYDVTEGAILLDGRDLRDIDVDSYRRLLGIVEQDVFLFDGTVRDNIAYARRGADDEHVRRAAAMANADGFIDRLEKGYGTLIGERGVRLSGGQKQRLAIARALLADPRILILDEATSNLDSESEALIQQSLRTLMKGRTCFVIAHRLSTIRSADQIVVIDHGRIIERGTHDELIAQEGRYWSMLQRQLSQPEAARAQR